jgi:hypothetical protein
VKGRKIRYLTTDGVTARVVVSATWTEEHKSKAGCATQMREFANTTVWIVTDIEITQEKSVSDFGGFRQEI